PMLCNYIAHHLALPSFPTRRSSDLTEQPPPAVPARTPAPTPLQAGQHYMPGLDGLRALAVFAVVAYHLGLGWAPAGLLGVGVFFTLSGYLITDLLLAQWVGAGRLVLGDFWVARARLLLPARFLMLVVMCRAGSRLDRAL